MLWVEGVEDAQLICPVEPRRAASSDMDPKLAPASQARPQSGPITSEGPPHGFLDVCVSEVQVPNPPADFAREKGNSTVQPLTG